MYLDQQMIAEHLKKLKYPLAFLDFETLGYAIPKYDGTRPYQNLPFQYSLHTQQSPDSPLVHYEFLFEKNENPMLALAERLVQDMPYDGSIVVYHQLFENGRLEELSRSFPDLSLDLENMIARLWDLEVPFAKKWFYNPCFNGSSSIKKVLPVMDPDVTYQNLDIQEGGEAQAKYLSFLRDPLSDEDRVKIKNDLLTYCKLDSFAMVRILDELRKIV
jgi:hypothetical protein